MQFPIFRHEILKITFVDSVLVRMKCIVYKINLRKIDNETDVVNMGTEAKGLDYFHSNSGGNVFLFKRLIEL